MTLQFHFTPTAHPKLPLHLVEEIGHRVTNEYAEAIAGLALAIAADGRSDVRRVLKQAADRLRAHAEAHRALLPPVEGQVNLAEYLGRVCVTFTRATLADCGVHLSVDSDDIWLSADRAWRIAADCCRADPQRGAARTARPGRQYCRQGGAGGR